MWMLYLNYIISKTRWQIRYQLGSITFANSALVASQIDHTTYNPTEAGEEEEILMRAEEEILEVTSVKSRKDSGDALIGTGKKATAPVLTPVPGPPPAIVINRDTMVDNLSGKMIPIKSASIHNFEFKRTDLSQSINA